MGTKRCLTTLDLTSVPPGNVEHGHYEDQCNFSRIAGKGALKREKQKTMPTKTGKKRKSPAEDIESSSHIHQRLYAIEKQMDEIRKKSAEIRRELGLIRKELDCAFSLRENSRSRQANCQYKTAP